MKFFSLRILNLLKGITLNYYKIVFSAVLKTRAEMKPIRTCTNLAYVPDFSTAIVFAFYYCQAE